MARVFSHRLLDGTSGAPFVDTYTVPADGSVVVVRSMDFVNTSNPGFPLAGFIVQRTGGSIVWRVGKGEATTGHHYSWRGRYVLNSTELLTVDVLDDFWSWTVNGYLLAP